MHNGIKTYFDSLEGWCRDGIAKTIQKAESNFLDSVAN